MLPDSSVKIRKQNRQDRVGSKFFIIITFDFLNIEMSLDNSFARDIQLLSILAALVLLTDVGYDP